METLEQFLEKSMSEHSHLCPRQVLGVRIGLAGAKALRLEYPRTDKRLLVVLETDGCFADGVQAVTGCTVGHRTLRVEDYGKIAATFIDTRSGKACRVAPCLDIRERAYAYAPQEKRHYFAQLAGYQLIPDSELLSVQEVFLNVPIEDIVSRAGVRVNCTKCGEEIINQREVIQAGQPYCRPCAGQTYYRSASLQKQVFCADVIERVPALG